MALGGLGPPARASRLRAVLVDAMGTLLSLPPPWPALVRSLEARNILVSVEQAAGAFGAEMAYYRAHHDEGRDAAALEDLRLRCAQVLRSQLSPATDAVPLELITPIMLDALRFRAYPDTVDALRAVRAAGLRVVVVSNWDVSLPQALEQTGLTGLVDGVVTSAQVGAPKPSPIIFAAGLALAHASAAHALHVGDSIEHDVEGALAAGIAPVLMSRGGAREGPANVPVIGSLADLPALATRPPGAGRVS